MLATAVFSATLLLAMAPAAPQEPPERVRAPYRLPERLLMISGQRAVARYTPGALDRANHVLRRLDLIADELRPQLAQPIPLVAVILSREEWEAAGFPLPYGLPLAAGTTSVAVPAAGDEGTVRRWKSWLGTDLPAVAGVPLVGTAEDAASLAMADIFLQLEACSLLMRSTPLAGSESWIRRLMGHLAATTLFRRREPSRMLEIETVFRRLRGQIPLLLEVGADRRMTAERWLLREAHLYEGATAMISGGGENALKRLMKKMQKSSLPLTRERLLELHPELAAWLAALPDGTGIF